MLKKSLDRMFSFIACGWRSLVGDWETHVERPVSGSELNSTMQQASLPCLNFYFMLALSVVIATFGLGAVLPPMTHSGHFRAAWP